MIFHELPIAGAFVLDLERREDERGFFARTFCRDELASRGLRSDLVQCSVSFNRRRGTLRGMHLQVAPFEEVKLVSCIRGAIYDVIVDLRRHSRTFSKWTAVELTGDNLRTLYVPEGCAHGFQTLADDTLVSYQMTERFSADHARGVRYNDPAFDIDWPEGERTIAPKDLTWPDFASDFAR